MSELVFMHGESLRWREGSNPSSREILRECTVSIAQGSWITLVGPNGSGKSTLLQLLAGTLGFSQKQFSGSIRWKEKDWCTFSARDRASKIAYVGADLDPAFPITVDEVVGSGVFASGDCEAIDPALKFCDLVSLRHRRVESLSGGERQRVALARALVQGAEVLFLDEALSKMDLDYQVDLGSRLKSLVSNKSAERFRLTAVVLVAHDFSLSLPWSDHAWVIHQGAMISSGPLDVALSEEVLRRIYPKAAPSFLLQK